MKVLKGSGKNSVLGYCCEVQPDEVPRFYRPAGVCFIKTVTGRKYSPSIDLTCELAFHLTMEGGRV